MGRWISTQQTLLLRAFYSQIDDDGYGVTLLDEILDHKCDDTAIRIDREQTAPNGKRIHARTTKGWWLLLRMKDKSTQWFQAQGREGFQSNGVS